FNKLNEYKNVFALSTEEFKKFAITQNEKVFGKDKKITQLLKTNANIVCIFRRTIELHNWLDHLQVYKHRTEKKLAVITKQEEVNKRVLIEQECSCQDYSTQELINKMPNLAFEEQRNNERLETKAEEITEYKYMPASHDKNSNPTITNNCMVGHTNINTMKTTTQNMDCSKAFSKLMKAELEMQYKKTVHTFTIWDILSEASPERVCRLLWKETEQAKAQSTSSLNKHHKRAEKDKEYSANDISINIHEWMVTAKQEEKLKEYKQEYSRNKDQDLEITRNITYKKKEKAKQSDTSAIQGKENCEILVVMLQILARLNKLKERKENKERNGAG
ncbi:38456_t:CDS:2, partial [Gigaspora margarita]